MTEVLLAERENCIRARCGKAVVQWLEWMCLPSAGTGAPTRMRLEISTCILLTICHSLQYQRTGQHYYCTH